MTSDAYQTLASSIDLQSLARQIAVRMDPDCLMQATSPPYSSALRDTCWRSTARL